jgi:solute:Na+ symporter, SSS family
VIRILFLICGSNCPCQTCIPPPHRFLSAAMNASYLLDALVLLLYFGLIIGVGLSQRSKSDSVEGFALGDRQIAWWAVLASILAAEISAATFLGAPGEGFAKRNWTYAQLAIGTVLARIFVSFVFIPIYYRHGVISIYEFLETRFGHVTRLLASATFLITRVLAMGTRLYVSAIIVVLAVEMFRGGTVGMTEKFWLYAGAVVFVTLLTAIYTTVGGIRAVIWTDFIQVGVLVAALVFTIPFLLGKIDGGWSTVSQHIMEPVFFDTVPRVADEGTFEWLKRMFSLEYTIYAAFIASTFVTMATHGIDQDTVQRMLTAKNRRQSAVATILSGIVDLPIVAAFILIGLLLWIYYQANPTPDLPKEGREVFPYFILHTMPAGLRGLVAAGILATAMGSLSTALNALATSFSRDFWLPRLERAGILVDEWQRVRVLRQSTMVFAGFIILVGVATAWFMATNPQERIIPLVLGILGFTFGSLLALFLVALTTRTRGNDLGNTLGVIAGIIAVVLASGAHVRYLHGADAKPAFLLAFPWRITLGTLVTYAIAVCFRTPDERVRARAATEATHS